MFLEFFYFLRKHGLNVSLSEWMALLEALQLGLAESSLLRFYHLCKAVCIKNEAHYDLYDQCFSAYFNGTEAPASLKEDVLNWLKDPKFPRAPTAEELARMKDWDLEELRKEFEKRLQEQNERHDGGSHWVGTGGTSAFGHSGYHPGGIRAGGESRSRSAMQVASERRFRNLRHDLTLDTRQMGAALQQLRELSRDNHSEELDLDATIEATAKDAGDLHLVFRHEKKNTIKLLLLMDVGGSMTAHSRICEILFSAAYAAKHFRAFEHYFFHNCPYESLYKDIENEDALLTTDILNKLDPSWTCMIVGDAAMHPAELTMPGGSVNYFQRNAEPGYAWLQKIQKRFPRTVWLNPDAPHEWNIPSVKIVRSLFQMFPLSLDGLQEATAWLRKKGQA